jgi:type III secretion system YscD/HrpQ family protein
MAGYLIAKEGPLKGKVLPLEDGEEWIIGRDPDESTLVLEDPSVSRRHAICRATPDGVVVENLSSVNPSLYNGKVITEAITLKEGDELQFGNTTFKFSLQNEDTPPKEETVKEEPSHEEETTETKEEESEEDIGFVGSAPSRWLLKVISGPNTGAEFSLYPGTSYILGKDPNISDVIFHDLSVSRKHAKLTLSDKEELSLEDLESRNGTYVNGEKITEPKVLSSQDLIAMGTTSFLVIDQKQVQETIVSLPLTPSTPLKEKEMEESIVAKEETQKPSITLKNWKDIVIPTKHLIAAGAFALCLLFIITSTFSLFHTEPITVKIKNESERVSDALASFPSIQHFFNQGAGKLFLVGHVLTSIDKQELTYSLSNLPFIRFIEDTIIIDELVWQNMNALFQSEPNWQAVTMYAPTPGQFILKGYVANPQQFQLLSEYINNNFPYPSLLSNQVAIETSLHMQVQNLLIEGEYPSVTFTLSGGELILSGRVDERDSSDFSDLLSKLSSIPGITNVQNLVLYGVLDNTRIDISDQYQITGFSIGNDNNHFVVINQRIYSIGDVLSGMVITEIQPNTIFLEKDGIKFKINYNLQ